MISRIGDRGKFRCAASQQVIIFIRFCRQNHLGSRWSAMSLLYLCDTYYYTFLSKLNESVFGKILPEAYS
jgi:hypothetical protein